MKSILSGLIDVVFVYHQCPSDIAHPMEINKAKAKKEIFYSISNQFLFILSRSNFCYKKRGAIREINITDKLKCLTKSKSKVRFLLVINGNKEEDNST